MIEILVLTKEHDNRPLAHWHTEIPLIPRKGDIIDFTGLDVALLSEDGTLPISGIVETVEFHPGDEEQTKGFIPTKVNKMTVLIYMQYDSMKTRVVE